MKTDSYQEDSDLEDLLDDDDLARLQVSRAPESSGVTGGGLPCGHALGSLLRAMAGGQHIVVMSQLVIQLDKRALTPCCRPWHDRRWLDGAAAG